MKISSKNTEGFSLIELMVSMAIGMFLIAGVFTVYINGRASQRVVDDQLLLLDDARFALETIAFDLRHAGLWGRLNEPEKVDNSLVQTVPNECATGWATNATDPVMAYQEANPYNASCRNGYARGDVLEMRYAYGQPSAVLDPGTVYMNADVNNATYFQGTSPNVAVDNFRAVTNAYYISDWSDTNGDGVPSLHRVSLQPGPVVVDEMLLSGVEDLQVQFGVDTDGDGVVNTYVNPDAVTDWLSVRSAQVWVVVRSRRMYPDLDTSMTPAEVAGVVNAGSTLVFDNDGYRRVVVSTVIQFKNFKNVEGV